MDDHLSWHAQSPDRKGQHRLWRRSQRLQFLRLTRQDACHGRTMRRLMSDIARTFSFFLLPTFSLQAFSSAVEVLRLANEVIGRNVYNWQVISIDGQPVVSSSRLVVNADIALRFERERSQKSSRTSAAIVCGGNTFPVPNLELDAWLRECRNRRTSLVGIASGSMVLARAGLAEGRRCAIHWEQFPLFLERFPTVAATQTTYEQDGDLYTCPGGNTPFDMFMRFVERDHGAVVVNHICEKAIAGRTRSSGDRQRLPFHSRVRLNHKAVIKVVDQMEAMLTIRCGSRRSWRQPECRVVRLSVCLLANWDARRVVTI